MDLLERIEPPNIEVYRVYIDC